MLKIDYYEPDSSYEELLYEEHIDKEMEHYRGEAVQRLAKIVLPFYLNDFVAFFSLALHEDYESTKNIIKHLDLDKKHVAALMNDRYDMRKLVDDERRHAYAESFI